MEGNFVIGESVGCSSNEDYDSNENPGSPLSYMNEKIQHALGHLLKDFEDGVFADSMGPKYGGYGSFLRSKDGSSSDEIDEDNNFLNYHSIDIEKSSKRGVATVECSDIRKPATDLSSSVKKPYVKPSPLLHSTPAEMKSDVNDGNSTFRTSNSEHRSLKLRIKVGHNGMFTAPSMKSGINSSSPSVDRSFEEKERTFQESNTRDNESPATMLQAMTSLPVRNDALLSPLPESILCLAGKESWNNDRLENNCRRKLPLSTEENALKKRKLSSMQDTKLHKSSLKVNNTSNSDVIGEKFPCVKDSGSEPSWNIDRPSRKVVNKNRFGECSSDLVQKNCRRSDVFQETNDDEDGDRAVSSRKDGEFTKLKYSCEPDNRLSTSRPLLPRNNRLVESNDKKAKKMKLGSVPKDSFKAPSSQGNSKLNQNRNSFLSVDDKTLLTENKASRRKRKYSPMSSLEIDKHESFMTTNEKQTSGGHAVKAKHSYKSLTEISRFSKGSEQSDISEINLNSCTFLPHKVKKKFDDKGTPDLYNQKNLKSECPLIEDKWVMCDSCEKWRLLPYSINPEDLPEKWLCNMLDWIPGMNSCDISEEETTKALCAQNQISPDVVLTYHQNYKDSGRAYALAINEGKKTNHESTQGTTKSLTRDCHSSKSAPINSQIPIIRKENHVSKQIAQNNRRSVPFFRDAETQAEKHICDGSFDDCMTRRNTKMSVLNDTSEVSLNGRAKGFGRNARVDSSSQKNSIVLPECSKNELDDSKQRMLFPLKVRNTKAPDAKSADLRILDDKNSEGKLRGYNSSKVNAVREKGTTKSKCAGSFNSNGASIGCQKKKSTSTVCSSASKAYECHDDDNMNRKRSKVSTDEKLPLSLNSTKNAAKSLSACAKDDFNERKKRANGRIIKRRRQIICSPVIDTDMNELNHVQICGNEDSKKDNDQLESDKEPKVLVEPSDISSVSPLKVPSSIQAAFETLKEAQILRDRGDSFRDSGFACESTETYFEAALRFLHGAYLLDSTSEDPDNGDTPQYKAYSTAAELCKRCSKEYERINYIATSSLAYKCMEVAFWNMVYCRNSTSSKDRTELQASLKLVPSGQSPSSSASDVENLSNPNSTNRIISEKGLVLANVLIPATTTSQFLRLLDYTRDAGAAVESSKKAQSSFIAAEAAAERAKKKECLESLRSVMNCGFQGVDRFVQLVRTAMKEVNLSGLCVVQR